MLTLFVFLILPLFIVFLEVFIPGGFMLSLGTICTLVGMGISMYQNPLMVPTILIIELFLLPLAIILALRVMKKTDMCLTRDQKGYKSAEYNHRLIGMSGVVLKDLRPSGFIEVQGEVYPAVAKGEYIILKCIENLVFG